MVYLYRVFFISALIALAGFFPKTEISAKPLDSCFSLSTDTLPAYMNNPDFREAVSQALFFQVQADSFRLAVEKNTSVLPTVPETQKGALRIAIRDDDARAVASLNKANEWFAKAATYAGEGWNSPVPEKQVEKPVPAEMIRPVSVTNDQPVQPVTAVQVKEETGKTDEFDILAASPYSAENPIPLDQELPPGIVYKIQLGAFSKPLPADVFKGLTPISGEKLPNGITKYYAGIFRKYVNAEIALQRVREYGYKDAYLVAFHDGKPLSFERARQLETAH